MDHASGYPVGGGVPTWPYPPPREARPGSTHQPLHVQPPVGCPPSVLEAKTSPLLNKRSLILTEGGPREGLWDLASSLSRLVNKAWARRESDGHLGDVDPQVAVESRAAQADEDAEVDAGPAGGCRGEGEVGVDGRMSAWGSGPLAGEGGRVLRALRRTELETNDAPGVHCSARAAIKTNKQTNIAPPLDPLGHVFTTSKA